MWRLFLPHFFCFVSSAWRFLWNIDSVSLMKLVCGPLKTQPVFAVYFFYNLTLLYTREICSNQITAYSKVWDRATILVSFSITCIIGIVGTMFRGAAVFRGTARPVFNSHHCKLRWQLFCSANCVIYIIESFHIWTRKGKCWCKT